MLLSEGTTMHTTRTTCRVCGSPKLTPFWTAGDIYVVGFPKTVDKNALRAPLTLCLCEHCWLVQLQDTVNPELLYREFFYRSGMNEMMRKELAGIATDAYYGMSQSNSAERWVLDIGCNDGTLLSSYPEDSLAVLNRVGIDPAKNIQESGPQPHGWWFVNDFFSAERVLQVSGGKKYEVITAIAMFYDLENPRAFVEEVKKALHPYGTFIVQMNYLKTMLESNGVDNICHEHLTYFSLTTLQRMFRGTGLTICHAELNQTNGGSIRVEIRHTLNSQVDETVEGILQDENSAELDTLIPYIEFRNNIKQICYKLNKWIDGIHSSGKTIYAYGASTRGTTLLQLLDTKGKIAGVAERDPNKYGRYMVGSWLPIVSEAEARENADYFFILPWHFFNGIQVREDEWVQKGGRFIIPLSEPTIVWVDKSASEAVPYGLMIDQSESYGAQLR